MSEERDSIEKVLEALPKLVEIFNGLTAKEVKKVFEAAWILSTQIPEPTEQGNVNDKGAA